MNTKCIGETRPKKHHHIHVVSNTHQVLSIMKKKELLLKRGFLDKVKSLRQTQNIHQALSNMEVEDDTDEWIQRLNQETAFTEAKAELATEWAQAAKDKLQQHESDEDMVEDEYTVVTVRILKNQSHDVGFENVLSWTIIPNSDN